MNCENCLHLTVVGLHDTGPRSTMGALTTPTAGPTSRHGADDELLDADGAVGAGLHVDADGDVAGDEGGVGVFGTVPWLQFLWTGASCLTFLYQ